MRRLVDLFVLLLISPFVLLVSLICSLAILTQSTGPVIFMSSRVGKDGDVFTILKFRTMEKEAPLVASSEQEIAKYVTDPGRFLRAYSLDELPQFINVLCGSMTLIGPRPCLASQTELIRLRKRYGLDKVKPGITGLAQVCGRDRLSDRNKVRYENFYFKRQSWLLNIRILLLTVIKICRSTDVSH